MTALPSWTDLPMEGLTAADYDALSEEVCRRIEVVDGGIVMTPAPRRPHQIIARRLANAIEDAAGPRWAVATDVDLRLRDVPLLNRRPDIAVHDAALDDDEVLRPEHTVLVVEVMSPGSITTGQTDKPAEYARAGIEHFWRLENPTDDAADLALFRYRLDSATGIYTLLEVHKDEVAVRVPMELRVDLATLR